jgi:multiple sugar transport system substrate-binding protein
MTEISRQIQLARALTGPVRAIGLEHVMSCYVVWNFAENIDGAKQFLIDYTVNFKQAFLASQFYNFPCFSSTVADLKTIIAHDDRAHPPDKYRVLDDVLNWATNVGYPGYANAAIDEIFSRWILNLMFAKAASGALSPEDALKEADVACRQIFDKWKERKLI